MSISKTASAKAAFLFASVVASVASATVLYTADYNSGTISQINADGAVAPFASLTPSSYSGLAVGPAGILYASEGGGYLEKISTSGSVTQIFQDNTGEATAIAVNSSGNIYVPTNPYMDVVSSSGAVVQQISYGGIGGDGMAFNPAGDLYYDNGGGISELTPSGVDTIFASNPVNGVPGGLACDSEGNVYAAYFYAGDIYEFSPAGTPTLYASGLNMPFGLAFDSNNDLFVSEAPVAGGGSVLELTPGGQTITVASDLGRLQAIVVAPEPSCFALAVLGSIFVLLRVRPLRRNACQHR